MNFHHIATAALAALPAVFRGVPEALPERSGPAKALTGLRNTAPHADQMQAHARLAAAPGPGHNSPELKRAMRLLEAAPAAWGAAMREPPTQAKHPAASRSALAFVNR
jgi:hypothetical protein